MKKIALLIVFIISFSMVSYAADINGTPAIIDTTLSSEPLPVAVITSANRLEISKIYEVSSSLDPSLLPRDSFERSGYLYECVDILREVVIGEECKIVTVTENLESKKNDMDTVLSLFPQYKEYIDEDGFNGNLLLNTATIKSEIAGYGSSSKPYTLSRNYPNLSDADTQHIPKNIDDNGRTLYLQDIQWKADNTYNADDYEIGDRYTAIATYGGTKTSSYVKSYNLSADYTGEVARKGVTVIRYTVIFTGTEIPAHVEEPEQSLPDIDNSDTSDKIPEPEPASKSSGIWVFALISILALLGCGACLFFTLKYRKETPQYEKDSIYNYPDTFDDDDDINSGDSSGI